MPARSSGEPKPNIGARGWRSSTAVALRGAVIPARPGEPFGCWTPGLSWDGQARRPSLSQPLPPKPFGQPANPLNGQSVRSCQPICRPWRTGEPGCPVPVQRPVSPSSTDTTSPSVEAPYVWSFLFVMASIAPAPMWLPLAAQFNGVRNGVPRASMLWNYT